MPPNAKTEQDFIFRRKTGLACTKILSFFGKRVLTSTTSVPPSDFPLRNKENSILFQKIRRAKNRVFCVKMPLVCRENCFYLLKLIIRIRIKRNLCTHRKIRRRIKKFSTHPGNRFSRPCCPFLSDIVQKISNIKIHHCKINSG